MKKYGKGIIAFTLLTLGSLILSGAVIAGGSHHGRGAHGIEHMAERLDLTEEQRTTIQEIIEEARPTLQEHHDSLRENRRQLRELAQADTLNQDALQELAEARGELIAAMTVQRVQMAHQIHAVLTPEQREKAKELMEQKWSGKHKHKDKDKDKD